MKPWGACAVWATGDDMDSPRGIPLGRSSHLLLGQLLLHPLVEIRLAHHLHGATHLEMAQPAELGARDFIDPYLSGLEVQPNLHSLPLILLHSHPAHTPIFNHIT